MSQLDKILIVGGGIAGLCTAIGLRDTDIEVDIVEKNPKWDVYGVGIIQLANALRALAALDIAEDAVANGYPMSGLQMYAPNGHQIANIPQPQIAGPNFPAQNGIARPKLHAILQEKAQAAGAKVRLGLSVTALEEVENKVNVTFTDGSTGSYDLVVGSDGLRSKVRELAFPDAPEPQYEDQVVWRYNLPKPDNVDDIWMYRGHPTVGLVPMSSDILYMFITDPAPGDIPRYPEESLAEEMRKRLEPYADNEFIAKMRDQITDSSKVVLRPFQTILVDAPWNRGRIVLVGDSAHSLTAHIAQGAALAIEDAVVLTEELKQQPDVETALANYNERRFERVEKMITWSRQICEWERNPSPDADQMGIIKASMQLAAQPI